MKKILCIVIVLFSLVISSNAQVNVCSVKLVNTIQNVGLYPGNYMGIQLESSGKRQDSLTRYVFEENCNNRIIYSVFNSDTAIVDVTIYTKTEINNGKPLLAINAKRPGNVRINIAGVSSSSYIGVGLYFDVFVYAPLITTSVNAVNSNMNIYPNPVKNVIIIESTINTTAKLYSILGTLVIEQPISVGNNYIDVNNLTTGVYTLQYINNYVSYTFKIIKN